MSKIFNLSDEKKHLILISLIVFTIFSIPLVNSTYFFGYDPLYYLMMTDEILNTGQVSLLYNHPQLYPITFAALSLVSGINPFYLIRYSLPFLIVFLGLSMYLFSYQMTKKHWIALTAFILIALSSGYNFQWFYQFHVNFLEHRPAYLSWSFNLLFLYSLSKYLEKSQKRKLYFVASSIFLSASLFTYFLSSGLMLFTLLIFIFIFLLKEKNIGKTFKTFFPVIFLTFLIFAPFFFLNFDNILEIILIERNAIIKARQPFDYFEFLGIPAILAIMGVIYSLKHRSYALALSLFFALMVYAEGYWLYNFYNPIIKMFPLSELVVRDLKVPTAFFAALGLYVIYNFSSKKIGKRFLCASNFLLIGIFLASLLPAIYGILNTEPFTYTDRVPLSAFEYLKDLPNGTIVSDELTCMMAYDFANKDVISGMYPRADIDFATKHENQKYIQQQLEDYASTDNKTADLIRNYNVKYFMLNFGIWGRITRQIEYNEDWDKLLDSDQASLYFKR